MMWIRLCLFAIASCAFAQSAETLAVVEKGADAIGFYSRDGKPLGKASVGRIPHEFVESADHRFLYVTDYGVGSYNSVEEGGNTLSVIDVQQRKTIRTINLAPYRRPHGIARGKSGKLYVTCDKPAALLVIDPEKGQIAAHYELNQRLPHMVAVDESERAAYIANAGSGSITVLLLGSTANFRTVKIDGVPMGLVLSPDGRTLFASNQSGNAVARIDAKTGKLVNKTTIAGGPARLAFSSDGHLYATLIGSGELVSLDPETLVERWRKPVGKSAEGILPLNAEKKVLASAQGDNRICEYDSEGKLLREFKTGAQPDPMILIH